MRQGRSETGIPYENITLEVERDWWILRAAKRHFFFAQLSYYFLKVTFFMYLIF